LPFDAMVLLELRVIADQIRGLNKSIAQLEQAITEVSSELGRDTNLISLKGIGATTSAILPSVIGEVKRFSRREALGQLLSVSSRGWPTFFSTFAVNQDVCLGSEQKIFNSRAN